MMEQIGKVLGWFEKANISVSPGTLLATLAVLVVLAWVFYSKYYPQLKNGMDLRVKRQMDKEQKIQEIKRMMEKQKTHDEQMANMFTLLQDLSSSVHALSNQLEANSNGHKVTLSVLLDIIECMQATTSPSECARRAQSKINRYLGNGNLPLQ